MKKSIATIQTVLITITFFFKTEEQFYITFLMSLYNIMVLLTVTFISI